MFFQIIATIILLVFYGCYFGKLIRQRRQNIRTDLLGRGKSGLVKFIEIILKFLSYAIVFVEVNSIFTDWNIAPVWCRAAGVALGILGVIIFIVSVHEMRDSWRAGVPAQAETNIVTTGIYGYSRNPAFLGFDLIYIGIVCMFFNWLLLVITLLTLLVFHLQIVIVEEPFMERAFGEDYINYKKTVLRYIGRRRRKSNGDHL